MANAPFQGIGNGVSAASNPAAYGGQTMSGTFGPVAHITGSYNLPTSSYLPFPNSSQNQQLTNNQISTLFANADTRNLAKQYTSSPESGVSTDFRHSPGQMANLLDPRAQAASQAQQAMATNPYTFDNANFNALMGLQGQQANEAFNLGNLAQNLYQGGQSAQMNNLGSMLGLFGNMFGGLTNAMGNLGSDLTGGFDPSSLLGGGMMPGSSGLPQLSPSSVQGGFNLMPGFTGGFTGGF